MLTGLFAKSIGTPQAEVDAMMASMPKVQNAAPPPHAAGVRPDIGRER